jgi:pyruvate, water dikinase
MVFTKTFNQINMNSVSIAGGKGASLGEMTHAKIPVPPGYVILSTTFEKFIDSVEGMKEEIDAVLDTVDHKITHTVENASERIQAIIKNAEVSEDISEEIVKEFEKLDCEFVAVRSSATAEDSTNAAWAGQLDTYLNTTKANLINHVRDCWASLFTPRAIFYRFEKELQKHKISVAVVIQKMVQSEVAGIAFSVHPVTQDRNQMIIEAGFGLGEAVVSGQITPDSYIVDKQDETLIDINVSEQERGMYMKKDKLGNEWVDLALDKKGLQKLSKDQILELAKLIIKIEKHYDFPVDVEWALAKDVFYITQSRPITTL